MIRKLKATFGGLFDTKASEFWATWAGVVMTILLNIPAAAPIMTGLNWAAVNLFQYPAIEGGPPPVQALIAVLLTYASARIFKKGANAPAK